MRRKRSKISFFRYLIYLLVVVVPALYTAKLVRLHPVGWSVTSNNEAVVTYIYDGDTVRVKLGQGKKRVRLLGVDAPEIGDQSEEADFWARIARRFTYFYLFQKKVILDWDREKEDSYGRVLAYVWLDAKTLFNELIIREGLAGYLEGFPLRPEMEHRLRRAEAEARREGKGRWQQGWPSPVEDFEAVNYLGQLRSINLICGQIRKERNFTLILSPRSRLQVFIPADRRSLFPILGKIRKGDRLLVFGLVEDYRGRPQVSLFFPAQLRINS